MQQHFTKLRTSPEFVRCREQLAHLRNLQELPRLLSSQEYELSTVMNTNEYTTTKND